MEIKLDLKKEMNKLMNEFIDGCINTPHRKEKEVSFPNFIAWLDDRFYDMDNAKN